MPIPNGYVDIEIRIKKDGSFERKIIREGKSTCKSGDAEKLLQDLMNIKIDGFEGDFGTVTSTQNTKDHWESQRVEMPETPQSHASSLNKSKNKPDTLNI